MNTVESLIGDDIVQQKEQELRDAVSSKIKTLGTILEQRDEEISSLQCKLSVLKHDFCYNLQLLRSRDVELAKFESVVKGLQRTLCERDEEVSRLKMKLDDKRHTEHDMTEQLEFARQHFQQKVTELNEKMKELQRQTECKLLNLMEERSDERQRHRQQFIELKQESKLQRDKLEEEHAAAISSSKVENGRIVSELKHTLQQALDRTKKLEHEIHQMQVQNTNLHAEKTNIEIRLKEVEATYRSEIDHFHSLHKNQLTDLESMIHMNNKQLAKDANILKEYEIFMQELLTENKTKISLSFETCNVLYNNENILLNLKHSFTKLLNAVQEYDKENCSLKDQLSKYANNENILERKEIGDKEQDELRLLRHQNAILMEVIKSMKRKPNDSTSKIFQQNYSVEAQSSSVVNCNPDTSFTYPKFCKSDKQPDTTEQFEIAKGCAVLQLEDHKEDCHECGTLREELQKQKQENDEQLHKLSTQVDKLMRDIRSGTDCEESLQIQKLEETITCLKTQMLNDLKGKLQCGNGDGELEKMTISDVRMMLLEQKLDRISGNVEKAMTSERETLLQAVNNIKEELTILLKDKTSFQVQKSKNCMKKRHETDDSKRLKSEETISKLWTEVSLLKSKLNHNTNLKNKKSNEISYKKCTEREDKGNERDKESKWNENANVITTALIPDFNSHTNLTNAHMKTQSNAYITQENKNIDFNAKDGEYDKQSNNQLLNTNPLPNLSSGEMRIDDVWALLDDPKAQNLLQNEPIVKKAVLHEASARGANKKFVILPAVNQPKNHFKCTVRNYNTQDK